VNKGNTGGDERAGSGENKRGIGVASGSVTRNASASDAGVETVIQVPPAAAMVEEPGATSMPIRMGMGGQVKATSRCDTDSAEALALSLNVKQLYDSNLRVCCQFLITY
jgi:hypothetical protein